MIGAFCVSEKEVLHLYPVSEAFLQAVQENTRRYYWTGRITTKAGVEYSFENKDIVKGYRYASSQCCGSTELELGTVYAAAETHVQFFGQMVINVAAEQVSKAGTAAGSIVIPVPSIYYGRLTLSVVNWTQRKHVELRR